MNDDPDTKTARRIIRLIDDGQLTLHYVLISMFVYMGEEKTLDMAKKHLLFPEDYIAFEKEIGL